MCYYCVILLSVHYCRDNIEPFKQDLGLPVGRSYLFLASKQVQNDAVSNEISTDCVVLAQKPDKSC